MNHVSCLIPNIGINATDATIKCPDGTTIAECAAQAVSAGIPLQVTPSSFLLQ
jgi:hypothetical protein